MIKFNEIKIGNFVLAEYERTVWEGEVTRLNGDEKQVCVETDVQEFWFEQEHLFPIPITNEQLLKLNFTKHLNEDGSAKYSKGAFRIEVDVNEDFSMLELWYREDKRMHPDVHYLHQLQNHYFEMTKVHLTREMV
jgi:hypothetical protein